MIEKESILKLLNKYGFNSFIKEPFLYAKDEKVGIYYSFKDPLYGYLNRVFLPNTIEEAEEFLKNYYFYKKKNKKKRYKLTLSSYEDLFATPIFEQTELIEVLETNQVPKNLNKKALRTAYLIIEIIVEKIYMQKCTYNSVQKIIYKYHLAKNKFLEKQNSVLNQKNEITPPEPIQEMDENVVEFTNVLKQELEMITDNDTLTSFILRLAEYLKELEKDEGLLKNKYYLIKTPIESNILEKKTQVLEELEGKKKSYTKKVNLAKEWETIENQSDIHKIVSLTSFVNNEKKRIDEKYELINEMDITTIADYLIEFDNLNIQEPRIQNEQEEKDDQDEVTFEQAMISLEEEFKNRPKIEQNRLYVLTSFLRNSIQASYQQAKSEKKYWENIKECIRVIKNPNNLLAKIKIFKDVDVTKPEKFIESLQKMIESLFHTEPFLLKANMNVFLKSDQIQMTPYIIASTKKNCLPIMTDNQNPITYIISLKKNSVIYFSPQELTIDINADDQLLLKENHPLFIIDPKKNRLFKEKSDIIKVSHFEITKKEVENQVTVTEMKEVQIKYYQKVEIERKEEQI